MAASRLQRAAPYLLLENPNGEVAVNSLIVEHVIEFPYWLDDCVRLLTPFDVFFVGVHCPHSDVLRALKH